MTVQPHAQNVTDEVIDNVIALDISEDEYMDVYAEYYTEWVDGKVIKLSPVIDKHDVLTYFLRLWADTYFEQRPIGVIRSAPSVLKLPKVKRRREPDLMIILKTNPNTLHPTYMDGAADIVIEVISPESKKRDTVEKFGEYEKSGIPEYWLFDPDKQTSAFYRLNEQGVYTRIEPDADGSYRTPLLPGLHIPVSLLWKDNLPGPGAVVRLVAAMLESQDATE